MKIRKWPNLADMFFDRVEHGGQAPFLWSKRDGQYHAITWRDAAAQVSELARGLRNLGIGAGDRVILISENRPEWLIADFAIMTIGAITVPAYTTNTENDNLYVLDDSAAKGAIVSTRRLAERLLPAAQKALDLSFVITMDAIDANQHPGVTLHHWPEVLKTGAADHWDVVAEAAKWTRTHTACIVYTSGTNGAPKGVMLSHGSLLHNCAGARDALESLGLGNEVFLCFLPLSHSYEHMAGQLFPVSINAQVYYAEGGERLNTNMQEARPTLMTAVPRLYEILHARITQGIAKEGGLKEKLFRRTVDLGIQRHNDPASMSLGQRLVDVLLDKLIRSKVRARFGGRLKAFVSGGAPLNKDVGEFFAALGLNIRQGYGLTEAAPVVSVNRGQGAKIHTVGPPLKDVEVKIAEDGEILVRGELLMQGYWRNEEATRESIRDGWLHTGDIGELDSNGHLCITDRKKDIIVNSGGDNIAPQRIEGILTLEPEIAQAMVYGDRRPHLVAVLVPDEGWVRGWAKANGKSADLTALATDKDLHKVLVEAVGRVNGNLSNIEKIRYIMVAGEPFSIDNNQMTPTMKIRRHVIKAKYGAALESLYG